MGERGSELWGLTLIALTVFLCLSLATFSPVDPPRSTSDSIQNAAGKVGAYLAHYLYLGLGVTSWLIVLFIGFTSWRLFRREGPMAPARTVSGWTLIILATASLLSMYRDLAGGIVGLYLIRRSLPLFGFSGSLLLFGFFFLVGMTLRSRRPFRSTLRDLRWLYTEGTGWVFDRLGSLRSSVVDGIKRWRQTGSDQSGPLINRQTAASSGGESSATVGESSRSAEPSAGNSDDPSPSQAGSNNGRGTSTSTEQASTSPDETGSAPETTPAETPDQNGSSESTSTGPEDDPQDRSEPVEVHTSRPRVDEVPPGRYELPPRKLLEKGQLEQAIPDDEDLKHISEKLEKTFDEFGIDARVVAVNPGPVLTVYEVEPGPGVSVKKIRSRSDDIKLNLAVKSVRIVSPIPGKSAVGIEVPNPDRALVRLRDVLETDTFQQESHTLPVGMGLDVLGDPVTIDLARLPHLLIAGATGSGKSVGINTIICSLLYRLKPHELKFILIDPKRVELKLYDGMPHLTTPVIDDPGDANKALKWAVKEMENRYETLSEGGYRNIEAYNDEAAPDDKMPYLVIVVDELADLMLTNPKECEQSITRLAQMARAVGIHMVLATQRPSTDVITGLIKANMPARISFRVSSGTDSRVILDQNGAETLLGNGDFLYLSSDAPNPRRGQGSLLTSEETKRLIRFIKEQLRPSYVDEDTIYGSDSPDGYLEDFEDEYYSQAKEVVIQSGKASASMLQRRFQVGYNRAARMIDAMEEEGIVGPHRGSKARKVLVEPGEIEGEDEDHDSN